MAFARVEPVSITGTLIVGIVLIVAIRRIFRKGNEKS